MDSCWENTPKEIVDYILKLACGTLVYRDNRYIEIGKLINKETDCINKFLHKKNSLKSEIQWTGNINRSWYLQFCFDGKLNELLDHGLSFDYLENNNFEICYWFDRSLQLQRWTRIRTFI